MPKSTTRTTQATRAAVDKNKKTTDKGSTKKGAEVGKKARRTVATIGSTKAVGKVPRLMKTPTQKAFVLQSDQTTPDPLCLKTICLNVHQKERGLHQLPHNK